MFTKEQREVWDKVQGPGLYTVDGDDAYDYLCHRIKWMLLDGADRYTILLIGRADERTRFLKWMAKEGVIEWPAWEPDFYFLQDVLERDGDPADEEAYGCRNLTSEDDTEAFCDFIRHAQTNKYNRVGAVVILYEELGHPDDLKHVDKLLDIPVWRGSTIEKHIKLPVFNVNHASWSDFSKPSNTKTPSGLKRTIELIRGDEIKPEAIEWLVPEFIPAHQATAFSGEMDTRKSTLALDIAATGSCFQPWFMQSEAEKEEVVVDGKKWRFPITRKPFLTLFAGAEDDYASTVVPRFMAAGGDRKDLYLVPLDVKSEKQTDDGLQVWNTPLSFDEHLELLAENIHKINTTREWKVGLLINDPIISFFGNKNYNSSQDTRDIMVGLKKLCDELQLTIINICHFNKTQGLTAKQKTSGAKALIEAHRQAWAFDLMEDHKEITLIAPIKKNLLKQARSYKITTVGQQIEWEVGGGFYQKAEVGVVKFVGYSEMTADDRIEEKESKDRGNRKQLKTAILDALKDGAKPAGQVSNELRDMASVASIGRAVKSLEEDGKLRRSGTNRNNMMWELVPEVEQRTFDEGEVNIHGRV